MSTHSSYSPMGLARKDQRVYWPRVGRSSLIEEQTLAMCLELSLDHRCCMSGACMAKDRLSPKQNCCQFSWRSAFGLTD
eukprot:6360383-Amphidinium_carterae.1